MKHKNLLLYVFLFFSLYTFGCNSTPERMFEISRSEYYRSKSPNDVLDALLIKSNAGATTSFGYDLFIVLRGATAKKLSFDYSQFSADKVNDIKITWIEDKVLQIDCKSARIFRFSNFWQSKDVQNYNYIVEIRISPTCRLNP